ncbi:MAG: hypothetical protein SVY53_14735 [Chloroflexota bacterium]|nr:hypothetical protein [Chloroflexota bacterium]
MPLLIDIEQDISGIHQYELAGGYVVLVGKNDRDNDHLSSDIAENNDWWSMRRLKSPLPSFEAWQTRREVKLVGYL